MNKANARSIAAAARSLAKNIYSGTKYDFGYGELFNQDGPCCAMGHVLTDAGLAEQCIRMGIYHLGGVAVDKLISYESYDIAKAVIQVEDANDQLRSQNHIAVKLNKLADAIEKEIENAKD